MHNTPVFISGAGPTGLAAALFLTEHGIPVRIIDKYLQPSTYSKAFAVNARTLTLLKSTGVTAELLKYGIKMSGLNLWRNGKKIIHLDLTKTETPYNFMLVYSQAKTEELLTQALQQRGIIIERGIELSDLKLIDKNTAQFKLNAQSGPDENLSSNCIFAADGAHSTIRTELGVNFPGTEYNEPWYFYDVEADCPLATNEAQVFILDHGAMFMLQIAPGIWRIGGNLPNLLEFLPKGTTVGKHLWDTKFIISHKVASEFKIGPVYLGGDAAHLHSPMGGRGMNLGIEDAFVFANLCATGKLNEYQNFRQPCVRKVVAQVARMTEFPRAKTAGSQLIRHAPWLLHYIFPLAAPRIRRWVLGLDHPVFPN